MGCEHFYWRNDSISSCAFHNLTSWCPQAPLVNGTDEPSDVVDTLDSPATFFIQLTRLSLALAILTIVAVLYNCISVLERNLLSAATCSIYWVVFLALVAFKALQLMFLIPFAHDDPYHVNMVGFLVTTLTQIILTLTLFLALDHERRFRSPDYASIDSPTQRCCVGLKFTRLMCSKWRAVVLILFLLPIALLIALEVCFALNNKEAPAALAWVYMASLLSLRAVVVVTVIHIVLFTKGNCEPTKTAKVYLSVATLLSLLEDLPNSLLAFSYYQPNTTDDLRCTLTIMTVYDLFQLLGTFSLLFCALFVRSQYLRIEQECKLVLVWDMQKLLQVNGRKDVIRHYT